MNLENIRESKAEAHRSQSPAEGDCRLLQIGIRGLIVAVACCGAISWAARSVWESRHPTLVAIRGLSSREPSARARAVREVLAAGVKDPGLSLPPLLAVLSDPAPEVRGAAAEALGVIASEAVMAGAAGDVPRVATAALIRALKDAEPAVRDSSMGALVRITNTPRVAGSIDVKAVITALAATLDDGDVAVRLAALNALRSCGPLASDDPPRAISAALKDRSAKVRAAAITALASFPRPLDPWLPLLLRGLEQEEPEVSGAWGAAIYRSKPPAFSEAAIPALIAALGSPARNVRFLAARALEPHAHDPRVARALIPVLRSFVKEPSDTEPRSRLVTGHFEILSAARMLGRIVPGTASESEVVTAMAEALDSSNWWQRRAAMEALVAFGPAAEPAVPALIRAMREAPGRQSEMNPAEAQEIAQLLAKIAPGTSSESAVIAALTEAVRSDRASVRPWAADALAAFGPAAEPAVPALIEALHRAAAEKNPRHSSGYAVATALAKIAPGTKSADAALAALIEILRTDSQVRGGAVAALPAFGTKAASALPQLRAWRDSPGDPLKWDATRAVKAIERALAAERIEDGETTQGRQAP
jgi:HEAT repeat protein